MKYWMGSQRFSNELMEGVKTWLSWEVADFDTGTQKLISWYDMCFNSTSDYAEK
jgi:hypothetical protein